MHYYKIILPSQLVRLREGDEIVLVIPPLPKAAKNAEITANRTITKAMDLYY